MRRYKEILSVLARNGLGFIVAKIALSRNPQKELSQEEKNTRSKTVAERVRLACEELGPTFVKLGQILSTRTDIIPEPVADELQKLQDNVPPFSFEEARALIEEELQGGIDELFASFNPEPVASASVSQVYHAKMHSGYSVAVKVQRPGVLDVIETDMAILLKLARYVDKHTKYGKMYDFEGTVVQLRQIMEQEMDFVHEGDNIDRFRMNLSDHVNITVPRVHWVYTTPKVLTMDYVDGVKINDIRKLDEIGADRHMLAKSFTNSLVKQILVDGFFHADPHPGNVMVTDDGTNIEFIDLGMAGELGPRFRGQLARLLLGVATQNTHEIAEAILDMDTSGANVNLYKFTRALDIVLDEYLYTSVENVGIARVFGSVFSLAGDFKLKIARELALVAKSLGTAQVIIEELVPNTSMLALVEETAGGVLPNQYSPEAIMENLKNGLADSMDLAKALPAFLLNVIRKAEQNDFSVDIRLKHLEEMDKNLERISTRISFTIVLLALCIVMAGVIVAIGLQAYTNIALWEISLFALRAGMAIAAIIIVGLVFNIIHTNIRRH